MKTRFSNIVSVIALVVALTSAGAVAKTVLLTGKQIKNNSLTTLDIRNDTVSSADIGEGAVTPSDMTLPPPCELSLPDNASAVVSDQFTKLGYVGNCVKEQPESLVNLTWSGVVESSSGVTCLYQLRINGQPSAVGGGEVFSQSGAVNVSTSAIFSGIPTGPVPIEVWAKYTATAGLNEPTCKLGPPTQGIDSTFIFNEETV